ncbi:diaminopropionate ammonia-lyase [soil metagenome]
MTAVARAVVNRRRRSDHVPPPGADPMVFHQRLRGYRPTPLRELTDAGSGAVWFKDESDRLGLPAFKILGASWAVEQTLAANPATDTLVAASAGNHGRAVAHVAADRHLGCMIYLPRTVGEGRTAAILGEGAQLNRVDGDYDAAVASAGRAAREHGTALIADTGTTASAGWVIEGYTTLFREAAAQAPEPFDLIIVPVGVGSLAAAAVRFAVHYESAAAVVGVEPVTAACVTASLEADEPVTVPTPGTTMTGLDCATPSATAWPTLRAGLAGTITVTDAETHRAMRELASVGITAGDCGATTLAALHALRDGAGCRPLREALRFDTATRVLCIGTEGATEPTAYRRTIEAAPPLT